MIKNMVIKIIFIHFSSIVVYYGQPIDTSLILINLKMKLYAELPYNLLSRHALDDYYNRNLNVTFLKSSGFSDIFFIKINNQILAVDSIKDKKLIIQYKTPFCIKQEECYFIYAYNKVNNTFYKILGTQDNDFIKLYEFLQSSWKYWKPINKINKNTIKQFCKDYWIEGVNMEILLKLMRKNCKKHDNLNSYFFEFH